jgi:hypothetical protein
MAVSAVRGAGSNKPSIVIGPGAANEAGSVAIGQDAAATKRRSLAIGPWTSVNADAAITIGSGDRGAPLMNSTENSVVLGAGSSKPSIVIKKVDKDTPGSISIHTNLVPEEQNSHSLGTSENRWKGIYLAEGIHIGGPDGTISYDTENKRLKLGDISANKLAITGLSLPEDTNFVALDRSGQLKLATNLVRENQLFLAKEIERLSKRVESLETENDSLKALFTSDVSWQKFSVWKTEVPPPQGTLRGMFVALSKDHVTLSYLGEENGRLNGTIITYELKGVNFRCYDTWSKPILTGESIDYERECRPIATDGAGKLYALDRKAGEVTVYPAAKDTGPSAQSSKIITWSLKDQQGGFPQTSGVSR